MPCAILKHKKIRVLIATDVASRGIDIEQLPYVVNFDLPRSPMIIFIVLGVQDGQGNKGKRVALICPDEYAHFQID
jgi:ATP-dependent RNA helicase RhlE